MLFPAQEAALYTLIAGATSAQAILLDVTNHGTSSYPHLLNQVAKTTSFRLHSQRSFHSSL